MKIAIDISPLQSGHNIRGVGFYLKYLKESLLDVDKSNSYEFFYDYHALKETPDVIHFPYFDPYFLTLPSKKKYKTVITIHDLTPLVFPEAFPAGVKGRIKWQIQKHRAKQADMIITDSEASKRDIARIMGIDMNKIQTIYLSSANEFQQVTDTGALRFVKERYNLPDTFALYVGDVTWNKNLIRLVRSIKKTSLPLVMVGKALANKDYDTTNPWNKDLVEVQKLCMDDKQFHVLGFVSTDDLVAIYNLATVFVMPSLYEGFGLPVLEAMQCGAPVITSKEGSLPEVAGDAAYFVDAYSEDAIAEGITKVISDAKLREEMKAKGLTQAKKFTWENTAKETIRVYESCNR